MLRATKPVAIHDSHGKLIRELCSTDPGPLFFFPFPHVLNVAEAQHETIKMKIEFLL